MEKQRVRNTGCLYSESIVNTHDVNVRLVVDNHFRDSALVNEIFFDHRHQTKNISSIESQKRFGRGLSLKLLVV